VRSNPIRRCLILVARNLELLSGLAKEINPKTGPQAEALASALTLTADLKHVDECLRSDSNITALMTCACLESFTQDAECSLAALYGCVREIHDGRAAYSTAESWLQVFEERLGGPNSLPKLERITDRQKL